ncbi:MAG: ATP phosphoribosyltransferase regulatory subunit [Clostridiales bacterium]|nr:ATP phosphoribosyltransferase regulatory subunit [Clostridiales bacterium]
MRAKKVLLPEGVQDLLINDCRYRRHIEEKLMECFIQAGYMEVSSPTLEYYDLFSSDYLSFKRNKMFKLIDTDGEILVLRPDGTVPIVRMVSTKMKNFVYPLKLCYVENVFRIDEEQAGKKREFRQAGVELFGIPSHKGDAEVIITAIESLKNLGLQNFQIELGQAKLLRDILQRLNIDYEDKQDIGRYIEEKNFIELDRLVESLDIEIDVKEVLKALPRLFGQAEEVFADVKALPLKPYMLEAIEDLERVWQMVDDYGFGKYITLDLGMFTMMKYYSGIIFKGFTKDLGVVLLSGGRYDGMMKDFGMDIPATGFVFIVNKITKALKIQEKLMLKKKNHILLIQDNKRTWKREIVEGLRKKGNIVELCLLEDRHEILEYIKRRQIDEVFRMDQKGEIEIIEDWGEI